MRHRLVFWRNVCYFIVHWLELFCVKHMQWLFQNFIYLKRGNNLFKEIVHLVVILFAAEFILFVVVCISLLWFSCLEEPLFTTIFMTVEHVFKRNLTCLPQLFNLFSLLFFIMYLQYLLIWRASALVHPHRWSLLLLTMENMCFATTFTQWEGSARKDSSEISSSSFTLYDFRTWPWAPFYEWLSTARIVLSSLLKMTAMIKNQL